MFRFLISAAVTLAPVAAVAAPYNPPFFIEGSPERNAFALCLWLAFAFVCMAFVIYAGSYHEESKRLPREAATRVRRRVISR